MWWDVLCEAKEVADEHESIEIRRDVVGVCEVDEFAYSCGLWVDGF